VIAGFLVAINRMTSTGPHISEIFHVFSTDAKDTAITWQASDSSLSLGSATDKPTEVSDAKADDFC